MKRGIYVQLKAVNEPGAFLLRTKITIKKEKKERRRTTVNFRTNETNVGLLFVVAKRSHTLSLVENVVEGKYYQLTQVRYNLTLLFL